MVKSISCRPARIKFLLTHVILLTLCTGPLRAQEMIMVGLNIIGASGGALFTYEMDQLKNGVFMASAIEALRSMKADADADNCVTVGEFKDYLARRVPELTGNTQRPSVVAFDRDQDFEITKK